MKKLLLILSLVLLISCKEMHNSISAKQESINLKYDSISNINLRIVSFTYKEHDYLLFEGYYNTDTHNGVVHNPDCSKCNKIKSNSISEEESLFNYIH